MNERLKLLRKKLNISQEEFGHKIGVTKAAISRLENGLNNFTDQMIKAICREFNVNEMWLREGVGEMFTPKSQDESLAYLTANLMISDNEFKKKLIEQLMMLDDDAWNKFYGACKMAFEETNSQSK